MKLNGPSNVDGLRQRRSDGALKRAAIGVLIACVAVTGMTAGAATWTWTGGAGGGDLNWNTAANWDAGTVPANGCDIIFPAVGTGLVNSGNNITGLTIHSVTITGSGYTVSGYSVSISAGFTNSSGALSAFNCPLTLTADQTFDLEGNTTFAGTIANNYALTVLSAANKTSEFQGIISGTGGITKTGGGVLKTSGVVNTYTGKTLVTGGTLFIDRESSLGGDPGSPTADQLTLDGGTLQVNNLVTIGNANLDLGVTLGAGGGTFNTDPGVAFDVINTIAGIGNLTKTGTGSMVLSDITVPNTYTGKTAVNQGTLQINDQSCLGDSGGTFASDMLTISGGATLKISGPVTIDDAKRGVTLGVGGGIILVNTSQTIEIKQVITGSGSLTKSGPGSLKLSTADNTYSGKTIVSAGVLKIDSETRLGSNPGSLTADQLTITNGATLEAFGSFTINGSNRGLTLSSGGGKILVDSGFTLAVAEQIAGAGALQVTGPGTLTLSGASSFSGGTTVSAGILRVANVSGSATGTGAVGVSAGATLSGNGRVGGAVTVANNATAVLYPNSSSTLTSGNNVIVGHYRPLISRTTSAG
jgi:autotransporter-associated beta strand protein